MISRKMHKQEEKRPCQMAYKIDKFQIGQTWWIFKVKFIKRQFLAGMGWALNLECWLLFLLYHWLFWQLGRIWSVDFLA
jgi:hypothetical protein